MIASVLCLPSTVSPIMSKENWDLYQYPTPANQKQFYILPLKGLSTFGNRSSKVCMEKGPARHTRTPLSSLPEPNTFSKRILSHLHSIPEPILNQKRELENQMKVRQLAKKNIGRVSWAHSTSLYLAHHDMNPFIT